MKTVYEILQELNESNSSNYKLEVLKKYKDNLELQRVLAFANDKVKYNFVVGKTSLEKLQLQENKFSTQTLSWALDILENEFVTRKVTGNAAIDRIEEVLNSLSIENREIITKIISRDLKINCGRTQIVKVFKDLITKQVYCRCDIYTPKTAKNIDFTKGAYIQKKSDGTFKETTVSETVDIVSRSGEQYQMPKFESFFKDVKYKGAYIGEMTVVLDDKLFDKIMPKLKKKNPEKALEIEEKYARGWKILDRATGNGLINSDDIPEDNIIYELWDYIPFEEYKLATLKDKKNPPKMDYSERFELLKEVIQELNNPQIQIIEHYEVFSIKEALKKVSTWMNDGYEGGVLKDKKMKFKDGTSTEQLKLKLEIELDLRIIEFVAGNKGSKNENYFSAIIVGNDEKTIRTNISVTSMTEDVRDWFHENRENVIGEIMEVKCNDITIGSGKTQYALSHGRFVQMRTGEKNETDTLERAFQLKEMAMELK